MRAWASSEPVVEQRARRGLAGDLAAVLEIGILLLRGVQQRHADTRRAAGGAWARDEMLERGTRQLVQARETLLGEPEAARVAIEHEQRRAAEMGRVDLAAEIRGVAHAEHRQQRQKQAARPRQ